MHIYQRSLRVMKWYITIDVHVAQQQYTCKIERKNNHLYYSTTFSVAAKEVFTCQHTVVNVVQYMYDVS
jgi:hypothetical protein